MTDQNVRTVLGTWHDYEMGILLMTEFHDSVPGGSTAVYISRCADDDEIDREAHEREVLRLAVTEWTAPDNRRPDDITFRWQRASNSRTHTNLND